MKQKRQIFMKRESLTLMKERVLYRSIVQIYNYDVRTTAPEENCPADNCPPRTIVPEDNFPRGKLPSGLPSG